MPVLNDPEIIRVRLSRFPVEDPAWVDVTTHMSVAEAEVMDEMGADKAKSKTTIAVMAAAAAIKDWNFLDSDGQKLHITLENVRRLELEDFQEIDAAIGKAQAKPPLSPQKKTD